MPVGSVNDSSPHTVVFRTVTPSMPNTVRAVGAGELTFSTPCPVVIVHEVAVTVDMPLLAIETPLLALDVPLS